MSDKQTEDGEHFVSDTKRDFDLELKVARAIEIQLRKLAPNVAKRVIHSALERVYEAEKQTEMFPLSPARTLGEHPGLVPEGPIKEQRARDLRPLPMAPKGLVPDDAGIT